jgi:hypothetical protein
MSTHPSFLDTFIGNTAPCHALPRLTMPHRHYDGSVEGRTALREGAIWQDNAEPPVIGSR